MGFSTSLIGKGHIIRVLAIHLMICQTSLCDTLDLEEDGSQEGCIVISGAGRMHEFGSEVPSILVNMAGCEDLVTSTGGKAVLIVELDGQEHLRIPWIRETTRIAVPANISAGGHDLTLLLRPTADAQGGTELDSTSYQFFRFRQRFF